MDAPFDSLANSDAFEQLCFDLIEAEGFVEVSWRGPGADGGRDIEAYWHSQDPTGGVFRTKWYVESKWYSDSVPFEEIEPKLLAASAARADYLLLITSSRVRNTAQDRSFEWLGNRGHPLRIRYWNGRDVVRLALKHTDVFKRHFPSLSPPEWSTATAEAHRLQSLLGSSLERLSWRIMPSVQLATNLLALQSGASGTLLDAKAELEFVAAMLRAQEVLGPRPPPPARRPVDISACVDSALAWTARRARALAKISLDPCIASTSTMLLKAAIFELTLNAAVYHEGAGAPSVTLKKYDHHWLLTIENLSSTKLILPWPSAGYRGANADTAYPSGQGLGCWTALRLASHLGANLWWTADGVKWTASLQGALQ